MRGRKPREPWRGARNLRCDTAREGNGGAAVSDAQNGEGKESEHVLLAVLPPARVFLSLRRQWDAGRAREQTGCEAAAVFENVLAALRE